MLGWAGGVWISSNGLGGPQWSILNFYGSRSLHSGYLEQSLAIHITHT
jgi:hypothetical protein